MQEVVGCAENAGRNVLAWHAGDFDARDFSAGMSAIGEIDHHGFEEVEVVDVVERLIGPLAGQAIFCMWSGDDGQVAADGSFNILMEVIPGGGCQNDTEGRVDVDESKTNVSGLQKRNPSLRMILGKQNEVDIG